MEVPEEQLEEVCDSGPIKLIVIREDLQEFYEVVSHRDRTVKCKLAGRDNCKIDGVSGTFRFDPHRGWFNFERHLKKHNVSKSSFAKTAICRKAERKSVTKPATGLSCSSETIVETKWRSVLSKERYCIVCLGVCVSDDKESTTECEYYEDKLKRVFPGCEGNAKLSQQLFFMFFLRNLADFPTRKCEELLKKCKGLRMPETWFSLCSICKEITLQAAVIHEELTRLQTKWQQFKSVTRSRFTACADKDSTVPLSRVEEEIRRHIFDSGDDDTGVPGFHSKIRNENKQSEDDLSEDFLDEESVEGGVKTENQYKEKISTTASLGGMGVRQRKCRRKNYKKMEEYMDEDDDNTEKSETVVEASTPQDLPAIIKVERELMNACEEYDEEYVQTSPGPNQDNDEFSAPNDMEIDSDQDYIVAPSEQSEVESEDSDYSPKPQSKSKQSGVRKKLKRDSYQPQASQPKSKTNVIRKQKRDISKRTSNTSVEKTEAQKGTELYVCHICPAKYKTSGSIRDHLEAHEISKSQDNKYDCSQCGYPCHSEKAKAFHLRMKHDTDGEMQCTLCKFASRSRKRYNLHMKEHKEIAERERVDGKYLCKHCSRLFITYEVLCKHKRTTHYEEIGVVPYQCEYCSVILSTKKLLRDHVQQMHKKQSRFFCELCGKGMMYMSKLRRHMMGHFNERKHVCEVCGADFHYTETLKNHVKKEHPSIMNMDGNTSAVENQSAVDRKCVCKHCGLEFASTTLLKRHIKSHSELYSNKCDLCGKGYATPQSLRRHKEINHTEREVPCTFCGKMFLHQEYIRSHYKFCKRYPKKKTPDVYSGEPLPVNYAEAQEQTYENTTDIIEAAIASSCLDQSSSLAQVHIPSSGHIREMI